MLNFDKVWSLYDTYYNQQRLFPECKVPQKACQFVNSLLEIKDQYDILLLDGFGVLNIGGTAVPHMPQTIKTLQSLGKETFVLTNGASYPTDVRAKMYPQLGYDIKPSHIISSRDAVESELPHFDLTKEGKTWGVIVGDGAFIDQLPANTVLLSKDNIDFVDGFIFLATSYWNAAWQALLMESLIKRRRPLIIGNPDISAPLEDSFSVEPGFYTIELLKMLPDLDVTFCGKPFQNTYDVAFNKIKAAIGDFEVSRILMVGDTLHTDILGGNHAGCKTLLKADWGFLRGRDPLPFIEKSGIQPDFIIKNN
ncbi:HAD hydrolase-like protein [Ignatzschineria rhizosphaerae]|uniref:HAD hydrolase-like protein n=1 Tax=Ignatzschineria rhizosphaerae TaxID=2923279 RepID=A0ABY3X5C4_9GAMM|nr:HAD hydrolase-like protein [Ignatzschineria rhizosphaerae]UNM95985.1 HAD hydrolase-like protein [Ignatzschineria rhizosphaerae]